MPVEEDDGKGGKRARGTRSTPQGSPISPLLSNVYMRRFVLGWKTLGYAQHLIVNFAPLCAWQSPGSGNADGVERLMGGLADGRAENPMAVQRSQSFWAIGRNYRPHGKGAYIGTRPGKAASAARSANMTASGWKSMEEMVEGRTMSGWANYFSLGQVSPAYNAVNRHTRLRQWLKAQDAGGEIRGYSEERLWPASCVWPFRAP